MITKKVYGSVLITLILLTGCTLRNHAGQPDSPAVAPSPVGTDSSAPRLASDVYPAEFRTDDPQVDAVIDAFLKKDIDGLLALVREEKCTKGSTFDCGDEPEGTVKPFVLWGSCEVNNLWSDRDAIRAIVRNWVDGTRYLFSAYRVEGIGENAYYLAFAEGRDDVGAKNAFLNSEGKITQLGLGCNVPGRMPAEYFHPIAPPK